MRKVYKKINTFIQVIFLIYFSTTFAIAQSCDCKEYIYLNEPSASVTGPKIHKWEVNANFDPATDPPTAALSQEIGSPWFDNTAANESLTSPHGLASDLNGNVYIGELADARNGGVRKFRCDGTIVPSNEFFIADAGYNFVSQGNTLYVNTQNPQNIDENGINAYDLCTGDQIGFYCLDGVTGLSDRDWGLYLDDNGIMYTTSDWRQEGNSRDAENHLFVFDTNTNLLNAPGENNPTCIAPLISEGATAPAIGSNAFVRDWAYGVVTDSNGFIYVVERTSTGETDFPAGGVDDMARILKYDSNGVLVAITPYDDIEGDGGYFDAIGIVYSKTLDLLLVSTVSADDDCVALFDTNLNYLGAVVPSPGDGSQGKTINITEECCPTSTSIVEDIALCNPTLGEQLFLTDIVGCILCEGTWTPDPAQNVFNFDACNNSIVIDALDECGTFTLVSDGTAALAQCGAFEVTVNICTTCDDECPTIVPPVISITNNICDPETAGSISLDTPCEAGNTIEYSTDSGAAWSTTQPTYDTANAITVRARCVNDADSTCLSNETVDVTSSPEVCATPCPPVNCINQYGEFTITKRRP